MILSAPLQGYTTAAWRHYHTEIYGGADGYFSPFMRVEKGEVRRHDLKDIASVLNENHRLVPQIIFRDIAEFNLLVDAASGQGYKAINLNLGCPFPPQVKRGRGSAVIRNLDLLSEVRDEIAARPDISFSVKMRLGVDDPQEWQPALELLNATALEHITVHPRTASQQYAGELHLDQFGEFVARAAHKVIFNGDISTPEEISDMFSRFPAIHGVMIGRGLLARPSMIEEYRTGEIWSRERQMAAVLALHGKMWEHYSGLACGDAQLLMQIKPFWDYLEPLIGHKTFKLIKKATTVPKYAAVMASIHA